MGSRKRGAATRSALAIAIAMCSVGVASAAHAADRGFELVSPPNDVGYDLYANQNAGSPPAVSVTPDGQHVFWTTSGSPAGLPFDGGAALTNAQDILSTGRSDVGWSSTWLSTWPGFGANSSFGAQLKAGSADGSKTLFLSDEPIDPGDANGATDLYIGSANGNQRVSPDAPDGSPSIPSSYAASDDLGVVAYTTAAKLSPKDTDTRSDVYVWDHGTTTQVSATVTGDDPGTTAAGNISLEANQVSRDGTRIFFVTGDKLVPEDTDTFNDVYAFVDGTLKRISSGGSPSTFQGATPDGRYAYFQTPARVLPEDIDTTPDVYRVTVDTGHLELVTGGTQNTIPGFAGFSGDGSHAYFRTTEILTPTDTDGGTTLYQWHNGTISYVAPLLASDNNRFASATTPSKAGLRVTVDGSVLVFETAAKVTADDTDSTVDVFRFQDGVLKRISQGQTGGNGAFPASLEAPVPGAAVLGRGISGDGSHIFFSTAEALVANDHNSTIDIYEYVDGTVQLVSPGDVEVDAIYHDNSVDGRDVFFTTPESIFGDFGPMPFLYDARVGGGFPRPPAPPTPCDGDACQGPSTRAPRPAAPATVSFAGAGNATTSPKASANASPSVSVSRVKTVRGTATKVKIKVSDKGKIRVSGSGLRPSSKATRKAGTYRIAVKLSKRSARTLKRQHRVKVRMTVRFSPEHGRAVVERVHVTFAPKKKHHRTSRSRATTSYRSTNGKGGR